MTEENTKRRRERSSRGERKAKARRLVIWILAGATIVVVAFLVLRKPVATWTRERAAVGAVGRAEHLAGEGSLPEALGELRVALAKAPGNEDVLRRSAFLTSLTSPSDATVLWERLDQVGELTEEDRKAWVGALISQGQMERAEGLLTALEKEAPKDRVTGLLRLRWYAAQEQFEEALPVAASLAERHPDDDEVALWKASMGILSAQKKDEEVGLAEWKALLPLAEKAEGGLGVLALDVLAQMESCPPELFEGCRRLLETHASRQERHLLKSLEWMIAKEPKRAPELIAEAMAGRKKWVPADRYWIVAWLNQNGYHRDALEMVSDTEVLTHGGLFIARLEALMRAGRLDDAAGLLKMKPIPLTAALYDLSSARVAVARGEEGKEAAGRYLAAAGKAALLGMEWGTFAESFRLARENKADAMWREEVGSTLSHSDRVSRGSLLQVRDILEGFGEEGMAADVTELMLPEGQRAGLEKDKAKEGEEVKPEPASTPEEVSPVMPAPELKAVTPVNAGGTAVPALVPAPAPAVAPVPVPVSVPEIKIPAVPAVPRVSPDGRGDSPRGAGSGTGGALE